MILSPFDIGLMGPIAALIPPRTPEPPAARNPEQFAAASHFAGLGLRLPMRPGQAALRAIVDAEDHVIAVLMPTGSDTTDADRAEAIADAINAAGGFAALRTVQPIAAAE